MKDILVMFEVIDWIADDIHYKSRGPAFYSQHLLADKVRDVSSVTDDIKEIYYLGVLGQLPPDDTEIAGAAITKYNELTTESDNHLSNLQNALLMLEHIVEQTKTNGGLTGGCQAILDEISGKASKYKFLVGAQIG